LCGVQQVERRLARLPVRAHSAHRHRSMGFNELTGSIPTSFGTLSHLQQMELSYNQLSGTVPVSLANLHNLTELGVVVGPFLIWAEPTSWSGVRSAADLEQWGSWSTGLVDLHEGHCKGADLGRAPTSAGRLGRSTSGGRRLGDADQGKPTWCGRLPGVLVDLELVDQVGVDLELVDQVCGRPGVVD
ncbi:unnamed protein product, partial [Closterium sp. Naga37s-1]